MKTFTTAFLIFILPVLLFSQVTFQKTFTITGYDDGISAIQTSDGNYLVYGLSVSTQYYHKNCILMKTDATGDSLWCKFYNGRLFPLIIQNYEPIRETEDSGFIFTTVYLDTTFLFKTNKDGDSLWSVKYKYMNYATFQPTKDGGYVICGFDTTRKICMIKIDNSGHELWKKWISWYFSFHYWGGTDPTKLSIKQTPDEGFIISGNSTWWDQFFPHTFNFLIKTDSTGDTLWTKKFHDFPLQEINNLQTASGNGFIVAGVQDSLTTNGPKNLNGIIIRFDESGERLWTKIYGYSGNQDFNFFEMTDDGGYVVCGDNNPDLTNPPPYGFYGLYLVRINASGDTLWTKFYPGGQQGYHDMIGRSVHQTTDGGFIVCGRQSDSTGNRHIFLIKTDGLGNVYPQGINDKHPNATLSPFPNPTKGIVYLNPPGNYDAIEISDLLGNVVLRKNIDPENNNTLKIDLSGNPNGIYLMKLKNEYGVRVGKIILEK